jgi:hypothetical protein
MLAASTELCHACFFYFSFRFDVVVVKVGKKVGGIKITREGPFVTVVVLLHLQKLSI